MSDEFLENLRYELKSVVPISELAIFESRLFLSSLGFKREFPNRMVNNLYFDSEVFSALNENMAGGFDRSKCRFRFYGDVSDRVNGNFEVKFKKGKLGGKKTYSVPGDICLKGVSKFDITHDLKSKLPPDFQHFLDFYGSLVLINRYQREYFVSACGRIRITIDKNLTFFDQSSYASLNTTNRSNGPDFVVIEFKASSVVKKDLEDASRDLNLRLSRCSKYVIGVEHFL